MLCAVYKSRKQDGMYLYIEKKDDFSRVPEQLIAQFGQPRFVMLLNLTGRKQLAQADIGRVKQLLFEQGFYLQIPPPVENLLNQSVLSKAPE